VIISMSCIVAYHVELKAMYRKEETAKK